MRGPAFNEKERKIVELHDLLVDVLHDELQRVKDGKKAEEEEEGRPRLSAAKTREIIGFLKHNRVDVAFSARDLDRIGPRGTLDGADELEEEERDELPFSDTA